MSVEDKFSVGSDSIDISGLDVLIKLCNYQPDPAEQDQFFTGVVLAEDMTSDKGVTLYTSGTTITQDRIARLNAIHEMNPELKMHFKIKRSPEIIVKFKKEILEKLKNLLNHRTKYKIYSQLLGSVSDEIEAFFDELFNDESIVLTAYKMKFIVELSPHKNAPAFFEHALSVPMFAFAIAQTPELEKRITFAKDDLAGLVLAALFYNIGAVESIDSIMQEDKKMHPRLYYDANRDSINLLAELKLGENTLTYMNKVIDYQNGDLTFVTDEENKGSWIANIITVADLYVQRESGLFGVRQKISHIVDQLNVMAVSNKLNKNVVKALTVALDLKDIFDFYQEMDNLKYMCPWQLAAPYPMTGFKSPTLFICKGNKNDCEHYEKSLKAITLIKPMGDIPKGKYARCLLTTPKLMKFYMKHYEEIKDDIKEIGKSKE